MKSSFNAMMAATTLLCLAIANAVAGQSVRPKVLFPEDLGPDSIDVSAYPTEYQETYKKVFLRVFGFMGTKARIINSPVIEMGPSLEEAERKAHPELFADPSVAQVTPSGWKKMVQDIHNKPRCCGACPRLSLEEARALWRFLVYDSLARKTGPRARDWVRFRRELVRRFKEKDK